MSQKGNEMVVKIMELSTEEWLLVAYALWIFSYPLAGGLGAIAGQQLGDRMNMESRKRRWSLYRASQRFLVAHRTGVTSREHWLTLPLPFKSHITSCFAQPEHKTIQKREFRKMQLPALTKLAQHNPALTFPRYISVIAFFINMN